MKHRMLVATVILSWLNINAMEPAGQPAPVKTISKLEFQRSLKLLAAEALLSDAFIADYKINRESWRQCLEGMPETCVDELKKSSRMLDLPPNSRQLTGHLSPIESLVFHPDGNYIAAGLKSGAVNIWDVQAGTFKMVQGDHSPIMSLGYTSDGDRLIFASEFEFIGTYDMCAHKLTEESRRIERAVTCVTYNAARGQVILREALSDQIQIVDPCNTKPTEQYRIDNRPQSIACHPSGDQVALGGVTGLIDIFDLDKHEVIARIKKHEKKVSALAYHPQGHQILSGSDDAQAKIWDIETEECIVTLRGHTKMIRSVAYHPEGHQIATAGEDGALIVWDPLSGKCIFTGLGAVITSIAYHPKGYQIACGTWDKTVKLWDLPGARATTAVELLDATL